MRTHFDDSNEPIFTNKEDTAKFKTSDGKEVIREYTYNGMGVKSPITLDGEIWMPTLGGEGVIVFVGPGQG